MNKQGILTLVGFAQKAGKLAAGEAAVENFLPKKRIKLLLVSAEIAEARQQDWQRQAGVWGTSFAVVEIAKIELGLAAGLSPRAVLGIMDENMAEAIMKKLQE